VRGSLRRRPEGRRSVRWSGVPAKRRRRTARAVVVGDRQTHRVAGSLVEPHRVGVDRSGDGAYLRAALCSGVPARFSYSARAGPARRALDRTPTKWMWKTLGWLGDTNPATEPARWRGSSATQLIDQRRSEEPRQVSDDRPSDPSFDHTDDPVVVPRACSSYLISHPGLLNNSRWIETLTLHSSGRRSGAVSAPIRARDMGRTSN
jgi:hypothetical protein